MKFITSDTQVEKSATVELRQDEKGVTMTVNGTAILTLLNSGDIKRHRGLFDPELGLTDIVNLDGSGRVDISTTG